jgi:hypothetical protein
MHPILDSPQKRDSSEKLTLCSHLTSHDLRSERAMKNCALALDVANYLRHCAFRRHRDIHVDVIHRHMAFRYLDSLRLASSWKISPSILRNPKTLPCADISVSIPRDACNPKCCGINCVYLPRALPPCKLRRFTSVELSPFEIWQQRNFCRVLDDSKGR